MRKKTELAKGRVGILGNSFYLLLSQVATMLSPAITVVLIARTMNVSDFAAMSYVLALVAVATSVMTAGLAGLAIREITAGLSGGPEEASGTLKSIVALREIFSCVGMLAILAFAFIGNSPIGVVSLLLILSLSLFFRAADAIEFWQQAQETISKFVLLRVAILLLSTGIRAVLILSGVSLNAIAVSLVVESAMLALSSWIYNQRSSIPVNIRSKSGSTALMLLKMSWILLLSGLVAQLSMRLGLIFLGSFSEPSEVARFAAASRLTEFAFVLPVVVTTASFPRLLRTRYEHGKESSQYKSEVQNSLNYAFWLGFLIAACGFVAGPYFVRLIFGESYGGAIPVLQMTVLVLPFVFMGAVLSKWIVAEDLLIFSLSRNILGLAMNVGLLVILVPGHGAMGAAVAYLSSFIVTNYVSFFWTANSRLMAYSMTRSMLLPLLYIANRITGRMSTREYNGE